MTIFEICLKIFTLRPPSRVCRPKARSFIIICFISKRAHDEICARARVFVCMYTYYTRARSSPCCVIKLRAVAIYRFGAVRQKRVVGGTLEIVTSLTATVPRSFPAISRSLPTATVTTTLTPEVFG